MTTVLSEQKIKLAIYPFTIDNMQVHGKNADYQISKRNMSVP